jgi:GNAT superfamily N-acetyltransferase
MSEENYERYIQEAAKSKGVSPDLLKSLIEQESNFRQFDKNGNPLTPGTSTALGLTQMIPRWNPEYDPALLASDPEYNIHAGAHKLRGLIDKANPALDQGQKEIWALGKYYGSKDPYENKNYANSVMGKRGKYLEDVAVGPPSDLPKIEGLTPDEVAWYLQDKKERDAQAAQAKPVEQQGTFGAALGRGIEGVKQSGQGVVTGIESLLGYDEDVQKRLEEQHAQDKLVAEAEAKGPKATSFQEIEDTAKNDGVWAALKKIPGYVGEKIVESAPATAGPLAAGLAAGAVFPPAAIPVGIVAAIVQEFGSMIDEQMDAAKTAGELDPERTILPSIAAGALDSIADRFTLGMKIPGMGRAVKEAAEKEINKTFGGELLKHAGRGVVTEGPTEGIQRELERYAAGKPLTGDEAFADVKESVAGGAAAGGGAATVMGAPQAYVAASDSKQAREDLTNEAIAVADGDVELDAEKFRNYGPAMARALAQNNEGMSTQDAFELLRSKVGVKIEEKSDEDYGPSTIPSVDTEQATEAEAPITETETPVTEAETVTPEAETPVETPEANAPRYSVAQDSAAIKTAQKNNTYAGKSGFMEGVSQPKGTSSDKLFSNMDEGGYDYGHGSPETKERIKKIFREKMFIRAAKNIDTPESKYHDVSIQPFVNDTNIKVVAGKQGAAIGQTSVGVYKGDELVSVARIEDGKIDSIGTKDDYRGQGFGTELLKYLRDNNIANIYEVPDRSPGFTAIQKKVIGEEQTQEKPTQDGVTHVIAPSRATTRYTAEQLSQTLSPEMRRLVESGKAVLHDTQATLPGENHPANVQGMTTADGVTHYVANKLTPESMQNVALHEVGVHAGMEKMLGAKVWEDVKNQAMTNQGKEFDAARAAVPKNTPANLRAEEALAYLVENSRHLPLVRRIIAAIRNFMRTTLGTNIKLTEADARQLAVTSMRRESKTSERTARKETAFSKGKESSKLKIKPVEKLTTEQPRYSIKQTFEDELGSFKQQADGASDKVLPWFLNIFSASGIYELGAKYLKGGKAVLKATRELSGMRDKMLTEMANMRKNSFNPYIKKNHKQLKLLGDVQSETTLLGVSPRAKVGEEGNINDKITKLEADRPKGFAQLIHRLQALQINYAKLNPEGKRVYGEMAKYYKDSMDRYIEAYEHSIKTSGISPEIIAKQLAVFGEQVKNIKGKGDYFPLMRFGKYGVAYTDGDVDSETGKLIKKFTKFDTSSEAKKFLTDVKVKGYIVPDIKQFNKEIIGDNKSMMDLYAQIDKSFEGTPEESMEGLKDFVFQMHLMGKSDQSIGKQFIHRKGTAGYSNDVFRAFDSYAMNMSRQLPRIKLGRSISTGLLDIKKNLHGEIMRGTFEGDVVKANSYYEAFNREILDALHPKLTGPISNFATGAAFSYYLTSPASALLQLSSIALQGIPSIGKTHGYVLAHSAMTAAANLYVSSGIGKGVGFYNMERGAKKYKDKNNGYKKLIGNATHADQFDVEAACQSFLKEGIITSGVHAEAFSGKGRTTGAHENVMQKATNLMAIMSQPFAEMESASRQIVATASYIANMKSGMTHDQAVEKAIDSVYLDMGDFGSTGRATLTKGDMARVVWQFQQYGAKLLFSMAKSALNLASKDGHERKEAVKHLTGIMAMHWLFAGALGLPAAGLIGGANDLIKDLLSDDEWHNYKADFRSYLEAKNVDESFINILLDGPLSTILDLKLSQRLGAHEIIPMVHESETHDTLDVSVKDRLFEMFGGAAGSLVVNVSDGLKLFASGDTERAIEKLVPSALVKNVMIAGRFATEGKINAKGDQVIPKESFTPLDIGKQAFGISPYKVMQGEEIARSAKTDVSFAADKRTKLLGEYRKIEDVDGDTTEIDNKIDAYNDKYPDTPILAKHIRQSIKTANRAKDNSIFGFTFGKGRDAMEEKYAGMIRNKDFYENQNEDDYDYDNKD